MLYTPFYPVIFYLPFYPVCPIILSYPLFASVRAVVQADTVRGRLGSRPLQHTN